MSADTALGPISSYTASLVTYTNEKLAPKETDSSLHTALKAALFPEIGIFQKFPYKNFFPSSNFS